MLILKRILHWLLTLLKDFKKYQREGDLTTEANGLISNSASVDVKNRNQTRIRLLTNWPL
jgi:hypothetical protein